MIMNNEDEIFKVEDVAHYLKIGKNSAYELIHKGLIRSIRIGKNIRVPKWCVLEYLQIQAGLCYNNQENRLSDEGGNCD
ncbi:helix-turn-helix domain-containing protein [Frisingicoccus sp.]|uniref:helix-turn-helix domain-containing protein n=1 Tax=Frisingicoccus sp. TaxID=1918627 RepID=UPI003AB839AF